MPGRTDRRFSRHAGQNWFSLSGLGRGPTMLMSPTSTFQNCGSSSSWHLRRMRPTRVTRGSSLMNTCGPSQRFCLRSSATSASALRRMVRNFQQRKMRPPFACRRCPKKSGKPSSSQTATAIARITGLRQTSARSAPVKSSTRLSGSYQSDCALGSRELRANSGEKISEMGRTRTAGAGASARSSQTTEGPISSRRSRASSDPRAPIQSGPMQRSCASIASPASPNTPLASGLMPSITRSGCAHTREIARITRSWSAATPAWKRRPWQSITSMRIRRCARMRPIASGWLALVDHASASPRCWATITWPEICRSAL